MDTETAASDSALSELNSEEVESVGIAQRSRSGSHSVMSASSDLSSAAASPRALDVPPAKRRKTGAATYDPATPLSEVTGPPPRSPTGSISSDTSGSVPNSPSFAHLGTTHPLFVAHAAASANPENPDSADYMQVTRCLWEDCDQPGQGNMDNLVQHIKSVHVVPRQKKYYCQWQGCNRKGQSHNSAYALNAHMRSHTKEKPFFCTLPECDRSFTRSDALAKHMRTVHETEALRPSDPVPRGHAGGMSNGKDAANGGIKRIKLIMGGGSGAGTAASASTAPTGSTATTGLANGEKRSSMRGDLPPLPTRHTVRQLGLDIAEDIYMRGTEADELDDDLIDAVDMDLVPFQLPTTAEYWPGAVWEDMDDYERALPPSQYFELLRRQIYWAESEGRRLTDELVRLRSTAEDVHGNQLSRGVGDEKGGDANRAFEWQQTEQLLDALLAAGVKKTKKAVASDGDLNNPWNEVTQLDGLVKARLVKANNT
ncbi:hypothetical protein DV736_g3172, partial [Chaetothyriales sp. CBS 134916]